MVSIDIEYQGGLRTRAVHAPSACELLTDAPVDNQGKGESFSPTDLVAAALGTCMLTIMGIAARKRGWDLSGAGAHVVKHMISEPVRRIGKLEVVIRVPGTFSEKERRLLEVSALSCPVHRSLHTDMEIPVRFEYGAHGA